MKYSAFFLCVSLFFFPAIASNQKQELCEGYGPQTPRDIEQTAGLNNDGFPLAPDYHKLNLCNIHTHTNAEHKGPGFRVFVNRSTYGGYACNETSDLTKAELTAIPKRFYKKVKPGDTVEVHWVYSSCDVKPGEGLGSCLSKECQNPLLRVESQVFLLVNDEKALNFNDYVYNKKVQDGFHQAKALPKSTGSPVVFRGSTTGPQYTQSKCSPFKVTWSVRPRCAKLNIASLHEWAKNGNIFNETQSHGVRQLVTAPELLAPIM